MRRHEFIVYDQEAIDSLTSILQAIIERENLNLQARGGIRSPNEGIDTAEYGILSANTVLGTYSFELNREGYHCILDLAGMSDALHNSIIRNLDLSYKMHNYRAKF